MSIITNSVEKIQYSDKWYGIYYRNRLVAVAGVYDNQIVNVTDSLDCIVENSIDKFMTILKMDCLIDASKMTIDLANYRYEWHRPQLTMIQRNKVVHDIDETLADVYWIFDAGTIVLKPAFTPV